MQQHQEDVAVFNILGVVAPHYGGLTRSAFQRASMLVERGIPVTIVVRHYLRTSEETLAESVERGTLDPRVGVLFHWQHGAPSGDGGAIREPLVLPEGTYQTEELADGTRQVVTTGGVRTLERDLDRLGRTALVRRFDEQGRLQVVEAFDIHGRQVTEELYDVDLGVPVRTNFLDRDGSTWVYQVPNPANPTTSRARVVDASVDVGYRQMANINMAQAAWIDTVIAPYPHPVVFVDSRTGDGVVLALKGDKVRVVASGHNNHLRIPPRAEAPFKSAWSKIITRAHHLDALVLLTDQQREDMAPILDPRAEIRVIPHPAQPPKPSDHEVVRSARTVICLARLAPQKRLTHAIEAFALVVKRVPDARLDIYGTGPDEAELAALIKAKGLGKSVFLRGHTSEGDVVLRGAACMLMSSRNEGLPLVLFEALSVGTPVVSYDLKYGPRFVIRDGVDGLLAPDGDVKALADAVVRVLTDDELRASMIKAGPEVLERFPRSVWGDQWEALVRDVAVAPPRDRSSAPASMMPAVSVIMPVLNEAPHLRDSVKAILNQGYGGPLELVLAVGPSTDGTQALVDKLAADRRIRVVQNPSGATAAGLNLALAEASHDIIVRVDGHAVVPRGYIARAVHLMKSNDADNVGGVMAAVGTNAFERAVARAMTSRFGVGAGRAHTGGEPGPADTVYLGVFRRAALERVGGYDERFVRAQDWEMNHRIRETGGTIWFDPDLSVAYHPRGSLRALARQYYGYGRWRRVIARTHAGTMSARYLAPPLTTVAVPLGTVLGIIGLITGPLWLLLGFLAPVVYAAAVVAAALRVPRSVGRRAQAWLLVVYPTMHASWGWGFLTSPRGLLGGPRA